MDEGLARFSEYFFFREYHPALLPWWRTMLAVERPDDRFIDDPLSAYKGAPRDYSRMTYGIAPSFFQELYDALGETAFLAFLQDYYKIGTDRFMTGRDFFAILRAHTAVDLSPLVKKYFRNAM
jgi:aminopeptidase N